MCPMSMESTTPMITKTIMVVIATAKSKNNKDHDLHLAIKQTAIVTYTIHSTNNCNGITGVGKSYINQSFKRW